MRLFINFVGVLLSAFATSAPSKLPQRYGLEGAWELTQRERNIAIPATVPGVVQHDLLKAGLIPEPYYRDNDKKLDWVAELGWTYRRSFTLGSEFIRRSHILLRCEGLDTLAHIEINGKPVASTDNMFRTWEFDVRGLIHEGENQIQISFDPLQPYIKAHENQAEFPGKPISADGWGYVRKAPFQQGWDFAPRLATCGIWRGIGLIAWDQARLSHVLIDQDHRTPGKVALHVAITCEGNAQSARVAVFLKGRPVSNAVVAVTGGEAVAQLEIGHPQLWWPNGMGSHPLYDVEVELRGIDGTPLDHQHHHIGLRTVAWSPKTASSPLTLSVNGKSFYAKGSNWVPRDSMIDRATPDREREMVEKAVAAHMNLVRLWGGGYYESDAFFDACDESGLLVWFEFKFADAAYPSFDPKWLDSVQSEAIDNVIRVKDHPCVAIWSGNNEVIGFIADKTDPSHMSREDYNLLFHKTLADIVHRLDPAATYTPGSPEIGDDHDWNVWHGSDSFDSYRTVHGFMSEFGFQAFPVPETVEQFTAPEDRKSVLDSVMEFHQRNWRDGNQLILSNLRRYYKPPKDFDSTLWLSQIQQSDGVLTGVEHWRRDWPNSSGSLVWQFDDCWPGISWSMVDYYGRPKALYYRLAHAYAPIALSGVADKDRGTADLWVVNSDSQRRTGELKWSLLTTTGLVIEAGSRTLSIPPGTSSVHALAVDQKAAVQKQGAESLLLSGRLSVPGYPDSTVLLSFVQPRDLALKDPQIRAEVVQKDGKFEVTLTSAKAALRVWIDLPDLNAAFSDNFVDLTPGNRSTIIVKFPTGTFPSLESVKRSLKVQSLFDTYLPGADWTSLLHQKPSGEVDLDADTAEIMGQSAYLEKGTPDNIGNWSNPQEFLRWKVDFTQTGVFDVAITVASPPDGSGSTFAFSVEGASISGVVPQTQGWTDYKTIDLGAVEIKRPGTIWLELKPTEKHGSHVMNFRSLTLKPRT